MDVNRICRCLKKQGSVISRNFGKKLGIKLGGSRFLGQSISKGGFWPKMLQSWENAISCNLTSNFLSQLRGNTGCSFYFGTVCLTTNFHVTQKGETLVKSMISNDSVVIDALSAFFRVD